MKIIQVPIYLVGQETRRRRLLLNWLLKKEHPRRLESYFFSDEVNFVLLVNNRLANVAIEKKQVLYMVFKFSRSLLFVDIFPSLVIDFF